MDVKQVVQTFKNEHLKAEEVFPFSLLPLLVEQLIKNGLRVEDLTGVFYQTLAAEIFDKEKEIQSYGVDYLMLLCKTALFIKKAEKIEQPVKQQPKTMEAIVDNGIIRTDHLVDNIPDEDDEGDPYHIAPEERIDLRPEDCAPVDYDEEFCKLVGGDITRVRR